MSKGFLLVSSVLLLGMAITDASAQYPEDKFRQLDKNSDGVVDSQEYQAGARASFASMDLNKDGSVDVEELIASGAANRNAGGMAPESIARTQMAAMDLNHDGLISENEFLEISNQAYSSFDKDGDGRLTSRDFGPR